MSNGVSGKEGPSSSKTERGRRRVAGGFDRKCSSKLGETKSLFHFDVVDVQGKRWKGSKSSENGVGVYGQW